MATWGSGAATLGTSGSSKPVVLEPDPDILPRDDRDVINVSTPGGTLKATEQGSGWWHVTFEGPVERALLNELLADMLRPILGEKEAA